MEKRKDLGQELQEKHMAESMRLIDESINHFPVLIKQAIPEEVAKNSSPPVTITEQPPSQPTDSGGPDKINEIRNEVAKTQTGLALDPDKQSELLEIIKQRSDGFEKLLQRAKKQGLKNIEEVAQKFKDELLNYVRGRLQEKNYTFSHSS